MLGAATMNIHPMENAISRVIIGVVVLFTVVAAIWALAHRVPL